MYYVFGILYMKPLIRIIENNNFVTSELKKILPNKLKNVLFRKIYKDTSIRLYYKNTTAIIDERNKKVEGLIPVHYYDDVLNFGDLVGPYLISKITGKPVLNIRNTHIPGIMAVGSILNSIHKKNMVVWGSGLIMEPTEEVRKNLIKYNPEILSLRGYETAKHLSKIGLAIPDSRFYGDPALLLPFFYTPSVCSSKKIGICPHYVHKSQFLENISDEDYLKMIDVQRDMETVVDDISSSSVCISTSLHGLIVAQAYGIPWVWLEIVDNTLMGDDFKFKDFFSTIDSTEVSHVKVQLKDIKNIDFQEIAKKARLPRKMYNEDSILESLKTYLKRNK